MGFQSDKEKIIAIIKKYLPDCTIYLFGSRARNDHAHNSDIDLALDAGKKLNGYLIDIYDEFEKARVSLKVDIIDMSTASDEMREKIERDKELWG